MAGTWGTRHPRHRMRQSRSLFSFTQLVYVKLIVTGADGEFASVRRYLCTPDLSAQDLLCPMFAQDINAPGKVKNFVPTRYEADHAEPPWQLEIIVIHPVSHGAFTSQGALLRVEPPVGNAVANRGDF